MLSVHRVFLSLFYVVKFKFVMQKGHVHCQEANQIICTLMCSVVIFHFRGHLTNTSGEGRVIFEFVSFLIPVTYLRF